MEAKKVLTLLNEQNYDELRRLCTLELCTKARKTTTATDKARIKLAKNCAKEMVSRPFLAGAFMWNGKQAIREELAEGTHFGDMYAKRRGDLEITEDENSWEIYEIGWGDYASYRIVEREVVA